MSKVAKIGVLAAALLVSGTVFGADVQVNWDKNCAKCHGPDGKGQTRMGRQSGAKDYTDPKVQAEIKDDAAFKAIKEGLSHKGKEVMKPMADKLSDEEIKALIEHVRAFAKK